MLLTSSDVLSIVLILLNAAVLIVQYLLNRKVNAIILDLHSGYLPARSVEEEDRRLARHDK
jgi:hypothetical protein